MNTSLPNSDNSTKQESRQASREEIAERIAFVKRLLLQAKPHAETVHICSTKWGVSSRQIAKYLARARRDIQKDFNKREAISMAWHVKARLNLIDKAMESNQHHTALSAMQDIAKLQGHYVEKVEHTGKDGAPIQYEALPGTARE